VYYLDEEPEVSLIAIISDVHADVYALKDALKCIDDLGCVKIVCAGDIVDYGYFPEEAISLMREREISCVRGNHDRWTQVRGCDERSRILSTEALKYLKKLPESLTFKVDNLKFLVVHGRPDSDIQGLYGNENEDRLVDGWLENASADILITGHTHIALEWKTSRGRVLNPGTLLREPKDEATVNAMIYDRTLEKFVKYETRLGTFGVFDTVTKKFTVCEI
jgi:putative phosphoesterase